jgi:hypothetical protein
MVMMSWDDTSEKHLMIVWKRVLPIRRALFLKDTLRGI